MKKRTLAASIMTIAMCGSIVTGATFALFTSESKTNVAITSGKVNMTATIQNLTVYSPKEITMVEGAPVIEEGTENGAKKISANQGVFTNGGTATLDEKGATLTLDRLTAGDKVGFEILLENESNVEIQYQTVISSVADEGLFAGLTVTIDGNEFYGMTAVSDWERLEGEKQPEKNVIEVSVELPVGVGNEYQETSTQISAVVNAIQGNAVMEEPKGYVAITSAQELVSFANAVNKGDSFEGRTVKLLNDIDMKGVAYTSAGNLEKYPTISFKGTFDGNGKTISNLTVVDDLASHASAGLFGSITGSAVVKDVTLQNANISSTHYAAGIVGYISGAQDVSITGCKVVDSVISSSTEWVGTTYDNGDKVGGIVGYTNAGTIDGCSVENTKIVAYRDLGGIAGYAVGDTVTVTNNSVKKVTLYQNAINGYKTEEITTVEAIIGRHEADVVDASNTSEEVEIVKNATVVASAMQLAGFRDTVNVGENTYAGKTVTMLCDIDLRNQLWTPIGQTGATEFQGVFDGNGKTIFNLNVDITGQGKICAGLFGWSEYHLTPENNEGVINRAIKNVNIDGAVIKGDYHAGALIGHIDGANLMTVENCHVTNAKIFSNDGKAGAVIGFVGTAAYTISGNSATACQVYAGRDAGQVIGCGYKTTTYENNTATDVTVSYWEEANAIEEKDRNQNINNEIIGRYI